MKSVFAHLAFFRAAVLAVGLFVPVLVSAQSVAITNVKIIVGTGQVIDSGTIIVRDGKIAYFADPYRLDPSRGGAGKAVSR